MATIRQQRLAKNIVETLKSNENPTKRELLVSSGYAVASAESMPSKLFEQKGLHEELDKLGFSIEAADLVVKDILKRGRKEESRIKAAQEIYKRLGGYAAEKVQSINVNVNADQKGNDQGQQQLLEEYEQKLKDSLIKIDDHGTE